MGKQLVCDLCGGKIVMRAGNVGVCEKCNMEYSLENLREKMGASQHSVPQTPVVNTTDDRVKNKLLQAQRSFDAKRYYEAAKYCKEVHDIDCTNQEAWFICVQAEALCKIQWAASTLAQSRQYIEDDKMWQKILSNMRPALEQTVFDEHSADCAVELLTVDREFAEEYIKNLLNNATKQIKERADMQRKAFEEERRKRPAFTSSGNDDLRNKRRNFELCLIYFQKIVQALGKLISASEQSGVHLVADFEKTYTELKRFFCDAEEFKFWRCEMDMGSVSSGNIQYTPKLLPFIDESSKEYHALKQEWKNVFAPCEKKLEKARQDAIAQYWKVNRVKKENLERECRDLQRQIEQLLRNENEIDNDKTGQELTRKITILQCEYNNLGIFKGKQKQAIQEQINQTRYHLDKWEKEHAIAKDVNRRQLSTLQEKIAKVNKSLQNPEI